MSHIYLGHPIHGAALVAIKQLDLPETGLQSDEDLAQFAREYEILKTVGHSGLARALVFFTEDGQHYLVEEFVPGETLECRILREGRLAPEEAIRILQHLLAVLEFLHTRGIIYRDLKPSNIILQPDGTPRLVDFGAARRWKKKAAHDTVPLGTSGYAPPEQYGIAQSDARSDLYGAGVLLQYMLTGRPPDPTPACSFLPPHTLFPDIPIFLGTVALKAVERDPARWFQTAREMARALDPAYAPNRCQGCALPIPAGQDYCDVCSRPLGWVARALVFLLMTLIDAIIAFVFSRVF